MAKKTVTDADKEKKFRELAELRMNKILNGIAGLSKLSAPSRYKYSPQQVAKMEQAFQAALNACFAGFKGARQSKSGFEF